jgi:hypothetical protein
VSPRALIRPRSSALSPPLPAGSPDALKKSVVISVPDRVGVEDVLRNARGDVEIEVGGEHGEGFERRRKGFPALRRRRAARSDTHVRYRHGECVAKTVNAHLFGSRHSLAWSASFDLTANEPFVSVPLGATAAARTGAAPCGLCPPFG